MAHGSILAVGTALIAIGLASPVMAQDAAETAVILSGSAGQGKAARTLGSSVSQGIGRASNAVRTTTNRAPSTRNQGGTARRGSRGVPSGGSIPAGVDPLAGTDATSYHLANGASITVSGRMVAGTGTTCSRNCPAPEQDR